MKLPLILIAVLSPHVTFAGTADDIIAARDPYAVLGGKVERGQQVDDTKALQANFRRMAKELTLQANDASNPAAAACARPSRRTAPSLAMTPRNTGICMTSRPRTTQQSRSGCCTPTH